jgi:hypothetical protein
MKVPNFFIVGAPRCGTTSLSRYLRDHPLVFMPMKKEPHFFARDIWQFRHHYIKSLTDYMALFEERTDQHLAVGEASVWYMYSWVALPEIFQYNKDARIVVMLRNPVDMVYSHHARMVYVLAEDERDFEKAWRLQASRRNGYNLPSSMQKSDRTPELLQYAQIGRLGDQVERLLDIFPVGQVRMHFFDDFRLSTQSVYEDVLGFLSVPPDGRTVFQPANPHRTTRLESLARFYRPVPRPVGQFAAAAKRVFGVRSLGVVRFIRELNTEVGAREPLEPGFRAELVDEFSGQVQKLMQLTGRDLNHWLA